MPSGAVTVGGLVINLAAETSQLKTDMAEGSRVVDAGAKSMINSMAGITESSDRITDAGARMVKQLKDEIATFGMTSQELQQYKANLNGVGGEVESLMARLTQMKAAQVGFTDQLAASEAQATQRIREMVAASMSEVPAMNDVSTATQGVVTSQATAARVGRDFADSQRLQTLNMQGLTASMKAAQDGTVAMSAETQRILAQYDPLGAKLRSLQSDLATLRKEMGNSVDPAAIKAFQGLEDEIAKTQALMARAAAQATALGGATSQLTLSQTQLIDRFRDQAATIGMSRSQLMTYQAAQIGVTAQTRDAIAAVKAHEDAIKAAADAKEKERNATSMMGDALKLLAAGYAALKVGEYIKDATMMAARYETLEVVMGVVGKTAGYTKVQMDAASEGVAKQGITMTESRNSVVKLVQAHIDLSNATTLARIAQDAAVIGNINSSEAFDRLVNGVARGNVLILRNIGINVNLQAAYAQMADSLGKSTRELTENERVQARLNAVLERGTDIAGTYEAAMDTASKQITSMKRYTEDLKTTFGEVFSEALTIGVMALTDGLRDANGEVTELSKNGQLAEWGHDLTKIFVVLANEVSNAFTTFQKFDAWARHLDARKAINADADSQSKAVSDSGNGMAEKDAFAKVQRIESARRAALAEENADYVRHQAELSGNFDRFQRAADVRMAARLSKQKADAAERLKVDQDYSKAATDILMQTVGRGAKAEAEAQKKVVALYNTTYVGTPNFRDTEGRESKPKVNQADNARLQNHLARIQEESAADKSYAEFAMRLDDMRHKAGELGDEEYFKSRKENLAVIAMSEQAMYDQELKALRAHHNSTEVEREKNQKAIADILGKQEAARTKYGRDGAILDEEERLRQKAIVSASQDATNKYTSDLQQQLTAIEAATGKRQKSKSAVEEETVAIYEQAVANMKLQASAPITEQHTQADHDAAVTMLADLEKELGLHEQIAGALRDQEAAIAQQKLADQAIRDWQHAGASIADSLTSAFGKGGKAIGQMFKAYAEGVSGQLKAEKELAAAKDKLVKDSPEQIQAINQAQLAGAQAQVKSYGDMAGAAAGFFDQHSRGYQSLMAVSQVFHAAELAMTMAELVPKAISAVLTQGQGDPYTAFGRMAAMGALVAGLGVAIGGIGGGADTTAKDRQAANGAGSILGDKDAKSESIKKAIDLIEKNTYQDLAISSSMLDTLRSIDSNISNFASQLVRTTDVSGSSFADSESFSAKGIGAAGSLAGAGVGYMAGAGFSAFTTLAALGGPIGLLIGGIAGKYLGSALSSIFGGSKSLEDSGFTLDKTNLGSALSGGVKGVTYADIKTSGGWFSSDKHSEQTTSLGDAANGQFTAIIESLAGSVKSAGVALGLSGDDFTNKLNSFVVDIGKVSLKDLKGDELQKALEAVFSKLGDDMAQYAVGDLQQYQQVGEGYLETLVRVASEYQTIDVVFQSFGKTFGEVGLASIGARDRLVQLAGGLDKFTSQGEYFLTNFFSEQEQAAALKARIDPMLAQYGLSTAGENASQMFRDFVVCLDTTTEAGAKTYSELMSIAPAFKAVVDAQKYVLDERKDLLDQLDELTMTSIQLEEKKRAAIDKSNLAIYDQIQAIKDQQVAAANAAAALQAIRDGVSSALSGVDSAFSVLQRVSKVTTDALTARITAEKALSDAVKSTLSSMKAQGTALSDRAAAQAQVKAALAIVQAGGPLPSSDAMQKSFSVLSQDAASMFATQEDYLADFYSTQNDIADLGKAADHSLSVDQQQLDSINAMLKSEQEQVDQLKGVNTNGLTLVQAMDGLTKAILAAKSNPIVGATGAINDAYQQYLGRAPDAEGLQWWQNAAASGAPVDQIVDGIAHSTEADLNRLYQSVLGRAPDAEGLAFWMRAYGPQMDAAEQSDWMQGAQEEVRAKAAGKQGDFLKSRGIPGFASGGDFSGGVALVGEEGPEVINTGPARIFNARQTSDLLGRLSSPSSNNDALAGAVDRLNATVERQNAIIDAQSKTIEQVRRESKRQADFIERLTNGGQYMPTKAVG